MLCLKCPVVSAGMSLVLGNGGFRILAILGLMKGGGLMARPLEGCFSLSMGRIKLH